LLDFDDQMGTIMSNVAKVRFFSFLDRTSSYTGFYAQFVS
jgi:hypothetical protein